MIEITYFYIIGEAIESLNMVNLFLLNRAFFRLHFFGLIDMRMIVVINIILALIIIMLAVSENSFFWCVQRSRFFNWVILYKFIPRKLWFIHLNMWIFFLSFKFFPSSLILVIICFDLTIFWETSINMSSLLHIFLESLLFWEIISISPICIFIFLLITLISIFYESIFRLEFFVLKGSGSIVIWLVRIFIVFLKFTFW